LCETAKQQTGGVGLGIAADDHHLLAHFGKAGDGVLGGGGFANATFAIDRYFSHGRVHFQIRFRRIPPTVGHR